MALLIWVENAPILETNSEEEIVQYLTCNTVTSGVPRGSVVGPLLFLLYINDLPGSIQSQIRLFVDDTAVYLTVDSQNDSIILQMI